MKITFHFRPKTEVAKKPLNDQRIEIFRSAEWTGIFTELVMCIIVWRMASVCTIVGYSLYFYKLWVIFYMYIMENSVCYTRVCK